MSPRWYDKRTGDHLALDTGGGALARLWVDGAGQQGPHAVRQRDRHAACRSPAQDAGHARDDLEWKIPQWSNAIERDRARIYFVAYAAGMALHFLDKAFEEVRAGRTKTFEDFDVPDEAIGCGFHEAVRGVLSHHLVIRDGKIANYHPYPPTPWNGSPTDSYGTPGPVRGRRAWACRSSRRTTPDNFRGIDIMRAVRSFDPCLPCGVHMYLGKRQDDQAGALADVRGARLMTRSPSDGCRASRRCSDRGRGDPDPAARETATELVQALLDMYGEGLARIVEHVAECDADGRLRGVETTSSSRTCCSLHGLHPGAGRASGCAARSTRCGPYLGAHGGGVELLEVARRRRARCAGGRVQRLPVVGADAAARRRGGDRAGGAGHRAGRGGGRGADRGRPAPRLLQIEIAGMPAADGRGRA